MKDKSELAIAFEEFMQSDDGVILLDTYLLVQETDIVRVLKRRLQIAYMQGAQDSYLSTHFMDGIKESDVSEELKPCPFCGSDSIEGPVFKDSVGGAYYPHHWIECNDCPVWMEMDGFDENIIRAAWNRMVE